ncbi:DNA adenine methylase [Paraburkholderia flagellata]|uniref:DNA adenine methylase n=1 Tax=Paraburkholderia flagellata TaxID=2883241 RepID=UPI001F1C03D8|nr:Dam family site-specific DNA-(adenine-N6)-methyltransferase [Paraburkholderia flagellata]
MSKAPRPFLKWVGGKGRLLDHLLPKLPSGNRLIEPFVGGGAIFLGTDYGSYVLGDTNAHLIELYQAVAKDPDAFVAEAEKLFVEENLSPERYNEFREKFNSAHDPLVRGALFLYLNKFGFNGLCRYNKSGKFNVPFGRTSRVPRLPREEIRAFAQKARAATFVHRDFVEVMMSAKLGDVVYCDPPYLDRDNASSFKAYSASGFDLTRHRELAQCARRLAASGIPVAISNHDCTIGRELYVGADIHTLSARRSISGAAERRGDVAEILAVFR